MNYLVAFPQLPSSREEGNPHLSKGDGLRHYSLGCFAGPVTADDLCA